MTFSTIHTCPLWEAEGHRHPVLSPRQIPEHGTHVGWVNVQEVRIQGLTYRLLLGGEAHR